jgi:hypothetical protein
LNGWVIKKGDFMSEYTEQATKFLTDTKTRFSVKFVKYGKHFSDDKESRDIYRFTFTRNGKRFSGNFGQSINKSGTGEAPSAYDVLSCLTKYEPGTFSNFCGDFGYNEDSRTAERVYKAVVKEWASVSRLWADVLEQLADIQ